MTPRRWIGVGWAIMGASAAFAAVAIVLALRSVAITCVSVYPMSSSYPLSCPGSATEFMTAVIFGVVSGVAFFSGLACFFWSVQRRW
jgi:hypothetical protein